MNATAPLASILNVEEMRRAAQRALPRAIFDYVDGGAEDEISRQRNRTQFDDWGFVNDALRDVGNVDASVELLGARYDAPFGFGPTGLAGLVWPRADDLLAQEAAAARVPFCLSTVSSVRLEDLAGDMGVGRWFQLYVFRDRAFTHSLVTRARAAGYSTLIITVDCPIGGNRERDPRNDFTLPLRLTHRNALDMLAHPLWALRMAKHGAPRPENMIEAAPKDANSAQGLVAFMSSQLDPSVTWQDVAEIAAHWNGPLLIKGVLSIKDAERAAACGATGVVVSNHGGRQLDGAIPALAALPAIRHALGGDLTLLCDGGFRRGSDILKAIALGANGVLMGRNGLYGAAAGGAHGVRRIIDILKAEIARNMMLLGVRHIEDLSGEHVRYLGAGQDPRPPFPSAHFSAA